MSAGRASVRTLMLGMLMASLLLLFAAPAFAAPAVGTAPADEVAGMVAGAVTHSPEELALVGAINQYRQSHGLSTLLISDLCTDAAQKHSSDMAKYGFTGHVTVRSDWFAAGATWQVRLAACGYDYATISGENCAYGLPNAQAVLDGWSGSPTHNANLLGAGFRVVGVGRVSGGSYGSYWTAEFGCYVDPTAHEPSPVAPAGLTATPGDDRVQLAWNAVAGASGYNLYRDGVKANAAVIGQADYLDSGLTDGTAYSYQVTAIVCGAETEKSAAVSATPRPGLDIASFLDVPATHAYYQAIQHMADSGIIGGYAVEGGREFRPANPVLRAQFAKMIVGALGIAVSEDLACPFADLGIDDPASFYPHEFVAAAYNAGIIKGKGATCFAPWDNVKRSQVVTMVVRALQNLHPTLLTTPPADYKNTWGDAYDAEQGPLARIAEFNGLLDGLPLTKAAADPWGAMSRGETAQVLWNVVQKLEAD